MIHSEESLAKLNPELSDQLHPTMNVIHTLFDMSHRSSDSVRWKSLLGEDHEWKSIIVNRQKVSSCHFAPIKN
jgi:hypothetical protein